MEITEPLTREHGEVLRVLERFEQALDAGDWGGIRETVRFFDERLVLHRRKEEEILFPALGLHIGEAHGPIHCMVEEHHDEREKIGRVRSALARAPAPRALEDARAAGGYILGLLRNHIAKEDQILYPIAEAHLTESEKRRMRSAMDAIGYCFKEGE